MRTSPVIQAVIAFTLVTGVSAQSPDQYEVVLCRTNAETGTPTTVWARELRESLTRFQAISSASGAPLTVRDELNSKCPAQVINGCYSESKMIYCNELALERALMALAVLMDRAERDSAEGRIDVLTLIGEKPYLGNVAFDAIDRVLFPNLPMPAGYPYTRTCRDVLKSGRAIGEATVEGCRKFVQDDFRHALQYGPLVKDAVQIHSYLMPEHWKLGRDLMISHIIGHESFHALRECSLRAPSYAEASGYFDSLTALQQNEAFCPNPPDNNEVNADGCALRWVEAVSERYLGRIPNLVSTKLARASAMLTLASIFSRGLRLPIDVDEVLPFGRWRASGYLYPHIRTALVHRTLYKFNHEDPRLGLCGEALSDLHLEAGDSRRCFTYVRVPGKPNREAVSFARGNYAFEIAELFPTLEVPGTKAGDKSRPCLDPTRDPPRMVQPRRGDPTVVARVVSVQIGPDKFKTEVVQNLLDRPTVHAGLSSCLPPGERKNRFRLRYAADQVHLDEVSGGTLQAAACVRNVMAELKFRFNFISLTDARPLIPGQPEPEELPIVILELERVQSTPH